MESGIRCASIMEVAHNPVLSQPGRTTGLSRACAGNLFLQSGTAIRKAMAQTGHSTSLTATRSKINPALLTVAHIRPHVEKSMGGDGLKQPRQHFPPKRKRMSRIVNATRLTYALPLCRSSGNGTSRCKCAASTSKWMNSTRFQPARNSGSPRRDMRRPRPRRSTAATILPPLLASRSFFIALKIIWKDSPTHRPFREIEI